ncbi:MAG: flagellar protein FliT [Gammaproteobacteria bacterium]|nr:flagellar protein FliT [Gammaproteobacteria bacterium]
MEMKVIEPAETLADIVLSMNDHMEELAADGEWEKISDLLVKRNAMLREIADDEKAPVLKATDRSTERIRKLAQKAHGDVGQQLAQLHRGKEATDSYLAHA